MKLLFKRLQNASLERIWAIYFKQTTYADPGSSKEKQPVLTGCFLKIYSI